MAHFSGPKYASNSACLNLNHRFYYSGFIFQALVHGVLDIIKIENIADYVFYVYFAAGHGVNCQGVDVPVAEDGLHIQLLVHGLVYGQVHGPGAAITHKYQGAALF